MRYENGQETSRSVEAEWLAQQPETRIVGYGTNITKKILEVPGGEIEYWRAVPMYATSYSPCRLGVPQCNDVTALGIKLQKGVAGVAKSWYAFTAGQQVYVPGYGAAIIADFGNGLPGKNLIDLGFSESDFELWHRDVTVYFLWPPPPPEQIRYVLP
jgi:resuscitation-promoting factor RpfB